MWAAGVSTWGWIGGRSETNRGRYLLGTFKARDVYCIAGGSSVGESISGRGRRPGLARWRSTTDIVMIVIISIVSPAGGTCCPGYRG